MNSLKLFFLTALSVVSFSFASKAQNNVVKFTPTNLAWATANVSYERVLNSNLTVQTQLHYTFYKVGASVGESSNETKLQGFGMAPELRFYPGDKEAPRGFFVGPYVLFNIGKTKGSSTDFNGETVEGEAPYSIFSGGANLGYQWLFNDKISLELYAGAGYGAVKFEDIEYEYSDGSKSSEEVNINITGFLPRGGVSLGFAF